MNKPLKKKIVYIAFSSIPSRRANSFQVMKMCDALSLIGHDVTLLVPRFNEKTIFEELARYYSLRSKFKIKYLPLISVFGRFMDISYSIAALTYLLLNKRAELYYTRCDLVAIWLTRLGFNVAYELHQLDITEPENAKKTKVRLLAMLAGKTPAAIIAISQALKDKCVGDGIPGERIKVYHDAVDIERFIKIPEKKVLRKKHNIDENTFLVEYCGSLSKGRGIEYLIAAAEMLKDIFFVIVGGEPQEVIEYEKKISSGSIKNIVFKGFVENNTVPEFMKMADILVMLYTSECDIKDVTSPMKLFEYLASGVPIVATGLPVLKESLRDGENAVFTLPDNGDFCEKIIWLKNNPEKCGRIGENNIQLAKLNTWKSRCEKILTEIL